MKSVDAVRFEKAAERHAAQIAALVRHTVREIYPQYYLPEIVDAFCSLHDENAVLQDIRQNTVYGLWLGNHLIGTGTARQDHITRVYVLPAFQGRGYGSLIMEKLEREAARQYAAVRLEASLPACLLYEHRGYRTICHGQWPVENGVILVYEIMEKQFNEEPRYGP